MFPAILTYFSAGELEGRDASAALTGNFTARDIAAQVSRGFKLGPLDAGVSGKVISQKIKSSGATSFAADLGLLYRFKGTPYSVGASRVNFGAKVKFADESFPLPMKFKAGAGLVYSGFTLDYALLPYGELGTAHRFPVGMKF